MSEAIIPVSNSLKIETDRGVQRGLCQESCWRGAAYWNVNFAVAVSAIVFGSAWFVAAAGAGVVVLYQQRFVQVTSTRFILFDRQGKPRSSTTRRCTRPSASNPGP